MAFADIRYYLSLLFGTSSLLLHILVLYVIVLSAARKLFRGVFWKTYALNSLYTVIMSLLYNVLHRWRTEPLVAHVILTYLPSEGFVPTIFMSVFDITCVSLTFTHLTIHFNRFTVLYLKQKHTLFWNRNYRRLLMLTFLIQIAIGSNAWFLDVRIVRQEVFQLYRWDGTREIPYFKMSVIIFFNAVFSTAVSTILTTYIMYSLIWNRKRLLHEFKIKQSDIKLCLFSSVMFIGYAGVAFSQLAFVMGAANEMSYQEMMTYQSYFIDLSVYLPPWALLCTSTLLWKATRSLLCCSLDQNTDGFASTVVKSHTVNTSPNLRR